MALALSIAVPQAGQQSTSLAYQDAEGRTQHADVYAARGTAKAPVLVMLTAGRTSESTVAWARAGVAHGISVVVPETGTHSVSTVLDGWLQYQRDHAAAIGVDPDAVAVFAPSGFVSDALPYVEDARHGEVKAAVFFYGTGSVQRFRLDVPIMFVRAGLDRPGLNLAFDRLIGAGLAENAPITVTNYSGGPHGFDVLEGGPIADALVERALLFVREGLSSAHRQALRVRLPDARAAGAMTSGDAPRAVTEYASLVAARPTDARLRLSYGEALLEAGRSRDACDTLALLRGRGLGPRDVGVPAAKACARAGDVEAALGWLRSIPTPFRPVELRDDPAFQSLRNLREFQELVGATSQADAGGKSSVRFRPPQLLAISVANLEESSQWYSRVFDLALLKDSPSSDGTSHTRVLASDELIVELSSHTRARSLQSYAGAPTPSYLIHGFFKAGFFVADLDAAITSLRTRGVTVGAIQKDAGSGLRWTLFRDNAGNYLQLLERGGT